MQSKCVSSPNIHIKKLLVGGCAMLFMLAGSVSASAQIFGSSGMLPPSQKQFKRIPTNNAAHANQATGVQQNNPFWRNREQVEAEQQQEQNSAKQALSNRAQVRRTQDEPSRNEKRIGIGIGCTYPDSPDTCSDAGEIQGMIRYSDNGRTEGMTYDVELNADGALTNESANRLSTDASVSLIKPLSQTERFQLFGSLSQDYTQGVAATDNSVFDSDDSVLFGLGGNYTKKINGIDWSARANYGTTSSAEDVTSGGLSGLARNNAGSYSEFIVGTGASMDLSRNQQLYADFSGNYRTFNRGETRGDASSQGAVITMGTLLRTNQRMSVSAELGYRMQETEDATSVSGLTAAARIQHQASKTASYNIFIATDTDESEALSEQGARVYAFGAGTDISLSRKTRLTTSSQMTFSQDLSDDSYDQNLITQFGLTHRFTQNMDARLSGSWNQVIGDAGAETETSTNSFTIGTGIDYRF